MTLKRASLDMNLLTEEHHDHLIDVKTGEIIEFVDKEIEELQKGCPKIRLQTCRS